MLLYCAVADKDSDDGGDMGATLLLALPQHITFPVLCLSVTMNSGDATILYLLRCPRSLSSLQCIVIYVLLLLLE